MKYTKRIKKWTAGILASTMLAFTIVPHMNTEITAMASSEPEYGTMTGLRLYRTGGLWRRGICIQCFGTR